MSDLGIIVGGYADAIVVRHPQNGSVDEAAKFAKVPVINAGDGSNEHPTQALVDFYTIFAEKKRLNNLKIGILGDLKYSRTTHSLLTLFGQYPDNHLVFISDPLLAITEDKKAELKKHNYKFEETSDLEKAVRDLDVLYVTRVQKERFQSAADYNKVKDLYRVNKKILAAAKKDMIVMHPLPRVNEIDPEIDTLPSAIYFKQAENSLYVRMALLALMLG
jgi:aspartate carbamoyltransferase